MASTEPPVNPPLVDAIAAKLVEAHATNVGVTHDSLHQLWDAILEAHEADLAAIVGPILADHVATMDLPEPVRTLFGVLTQPEHQTQFFTALFAVRAIIDQFVFAAIAPLVQDVTNQAWPRLGPSMPLSPAEVALGMLRHTLAGIDPYAEAAMSGVNRARLDVLAKNTGDSIPIAEALLLYRRGKLTPGRLQAAIEQSRTRDEWIPEILELRYAPPSVGEVLAGAVQNQLPDTQARQLFQEAGIDPVNYDWMLRTHGRPPGIAQMADLWNRGVIGQTEFDQAVRESDIKDKYVPMLEQLRVYIPPVRSVMAMLRAGAISDAEATRLFQENGVRSTDIPGYLAEAHHAKTATARELSQAQIIRLYGAQLIDRPTAQLRLEALHYDPASVGLLLDYADALRHERYVNAVISRVHSRYTSYKLTDAEVTNALQRDKVPQAAIDDLLALWKIERDANLHVLSPAAIVGAYRRTLISPAETKRRLLAVGVQPADIGIIVADGFPPTKFSRAVVDAVVNA